MSSSRRKLRSRRLFYLTYPLYLLLIVLVGAEFVLRIIGYQPWTPAAQSFEVNPEGPFFRADSLLGYAGRPGQFEITLADTLTYTVTHNAQGNRITSALDEMDTLNRPEIWILGCSFTHGFGVNDEETYPWMVQESLPAYKVRNLGMDGYGTLQSWMQLEQMMKEADRLPALVVLAYGAFHDQRNTSNRYWRKVLHGREVVDGLRYPHIRFDERDSLEIGYSELEYDAFPLMQYSALSHYLEMSYNRRQDEQLRSKEVTRVLLERILETLSNRGVSFLMTGIFDHPETRAMLGEMQQRGISTLDISQDLERADLRILPSDGHPNEKAHRSMAKRLVAWIVENMVKQ